jgi:hypothetical protein
MKQPNRPKDQKRNITTKQLNNFSGFVSFFLLRPGMHTNKHGQDCIRKGLGCILREAWAACALRRIFIIVAVRSLQQLLQRSNTTHSLTHSLTKKAYSLLTVHYSLTVQSANHYHTFISFFNS